MSICTQEDKMMLEEKLRKTEENLTRQLSYTQQVMHIFNFPVVSCISFSLWQMYLLVGGWFSYCLARELTWE